MNWQSSPSRYRCSIIKSKNKTETLYLAPVLRKSQIEGKTLQPPLAYGDLGRKPDIPPDSRITYLFGLLHFEKQKEMAEMTWAQVGGDFEPLDFSQSDVLLWYDNDAI